MKLGHVAIWTEYLEELKAFYVTYFDATAGEKLTDVSGNFASDFLTFSGGANLELMQMSGLTHIAFDAASSQEIDALTARLQQDG